MAQTVAMKLMTRYYGGNVLLRGTFLECQRRSKDFFFSVNIFRTQISVCCKTRDNGSIKQFYRLSHGYLMVELDTFTIHISRDKYYL